MAYSRTNWNNDAAPAIDATNLNNIEQGIVDAHADVAALTASFNNEAWSAWVNYSDSSDGFTLSHNDSVFADTSVAGFGLKLPAAPVTGDKVRICDVTGSFSSNNLTVDGNGNDVMGGATLALDLDNASVEFVFSGLTNGWRIIAKA